MCRCSRPVGLGPGQRGRPPRGRTPGLARGRSGRDASAPQRGARFLTARSCCRSSSRTTRSQRPGADRDGRRRDRERTLPVCPPFIPACARDAGSIFIVVRPPVGGVAADRRRRGRTAAPPPPATRWPCSSRLRLGDPDRPRGIELLLHHARRAGPPARAGVPRRARRAAPLSFAHDRRVPRDGTGRAALCRHRAGPAARAATDAGTSRLREG